MIVVIVLMIVIIVLMIAVIAPTTAIVDTVPAPAAVVEAKEAGREVCVALIAERWVISAGSALGVMWCASIATRRGICPRRARKRSVHHAIRSPHCCAQTRYLHSAVI